MKTTLPKGLMAAGAELTVPSLTPHPHSRCAAATSDSASATKTAQAQEGSTEFILRTLHTQVQGYQSAKMSYQFTCRNWP